jgi:hypothetical protein
MFVIAKKPAFWWSIQIKLLDDNNYSEGEFKGLFKNLGTQEFIDLMNDPNKHDLETLKTILVGWVDLKLPDGSEVPFSEDKLIEFNDIIGFTASVLRSYYTALNGAARIKN